MPKQATSRISMPMGVKPMNLGLPPIGQRKMVGKQKRRRVARRPYTKGGEKNA